MPVALDETLQLGRRPMVPRAPKPADPADEYALTALQTRAAQTPAESATATALRALANKGLYSPQAVQDYTTRETAIRLSGGATLSPYEGPPIEYGPSIYGTGGPRYEPDTRDWNDIGAGDIIGGLRGVDQVFADAGSSLTAGLIPGQDSRGSNAIPAAFAGEIVRPTSIAAMGLPMVKGPTVIQTFLRNAAIQGAANVGQDLALGRNDPNDLLLSAGLGGALGGALAPGVPSTAFGTAADRFQRLALEEIGGSNVDRIKELRRAIAMGETEFDRTAGAEGRALILDQLEANKQELARLENAPLPGQSDMFGGVVEEAAATPPPVEAASPGMFAEPGPTAARPPAAATPTPPALVSAVDEGAALPVAIASPDEIRTDPRLQARQVDKGKTYVERDVQAIVRNYDPAKMDPLIVARDPENPGGYVLGAGHHRLEALRRMDRPIPIRIVEDDISTPAGFEHFREIADASNATGKSLDLHGRINAFRNVGSEQPGDIQAAGFRFTDQQITDTLDIGRMPQDVIDRVNTEEALQPLAAEAGRAVRVYGINEHDAAGLFRDFTKKDKGAKLPTRAAMRASIEKFGPQLEELAQSNMFADRAAADFADKNPIIEAIRIHADLSGDLKARKAQLARDVKSTERLGGSQAAINRAKKEIAGLEKQQADLESNFARFVQRLGEEKPKARGQAAKSEPRVSQSRQVSKPKKEPHPAIAAATDEEIAHFRDLIERGDWTQNPNARIGAKATLNAMLRGEEPTDKQLTQLFRALNAEPPKPKIDAPTPKPSTGGAEAPPPVEPPAPPSAGGLPDFEGKRLEGDAGGQALLDDIGGRGDVSGDLARGIDDAMRTPNNLSPLERERVLSPYADATERAADDVTATLVNRALDDVQPRQRWTRILKMAISPLQMVRTVKTSFDVGWGGRQGWRLFPRNPREWMAMYGNQFRAMFSEKAAQEMRARTQALPHHQALQDLPRPLAFLERGTGDPTKSGEEFLSTTSANWWGFKHSERAYVEPGNLLRGEVAEKMIADIEKVTKQPITKADLQFVADNINNATLRGNTRFLGHTWGQVAGSTLFSAKGLVSGPQFLADAIRVVADDSISPAAKRVVQKQVGAYIGMGMTTLALMAGAGYVLNEKGKPEYLSADLNWKSPQFGTVRLGGLTWNFWGGDQPLVRYALMLKNGSQDIAGVPTKRNRWKETGNIVRSKLAPGAPAALWDSIVRQGHAYTGQDLGNPKELATYALDQVTPIFLTSALETYHNRGAAYIAPSLAAEMSGFSTSTYQQQATPQQKAKQSLTKLPAYKAYEAAPAEMWQTLVAQGAFPPGFDNFEDFKDALKEELAPQFEGMAPEVIDVFVEDLPAIKRYDSMVRDYRASLREGDPELTRLLIQSGEKEPGKGDLPALAGATK